MELKWMVLIGTVATISTWWIGQQNGSVDVRYLNFNHSILFYLGATLGSIGIIMLCKPFERFSNNLIFKVIAFYGMNTLIIMATHIDFRVLRFGISFADFSFYNHELTILYTIYILIFVLVIEFFIIKILSKICPFFIRKKKEKKI